MSPALKVAGVDICGSAKFVLSIFSIFTELAVNPKTLVPTKYIPVWVSALNENDGADTEPLFAKNTPLVVCVNENN